MLFFLGDTNAIGSKYYVFNVWWELLFAIGGKISHTVSDLVHTYAFFNAFCRNAVQSI